MLEAIDTLRREQRNVLACLTVWEGYRQYMAEANVLLGAPDESQATLSRLLDKHVLRSILREHQLSRVESEIVTPEVLERLSREGAKKFIKPRRGLASFGAFTYRPDLTWDTLLKLRQEMATDSDFRDTFDEAKDFVAEDYIEGTEHSFEVIACGGEPHLIGIHEKVALNIDGLVQNGKPVAMLASRYVGTCLEYAQGGPLGSIQMEMDPELCAWAERCLEAVALRSSSFHLEGILSPEGPVFLEIAARVGGADVVDCFELAMGIHMPSVELAFMVGETPELRRSNTLSAPDMRFGWFVFPGHLLGGGHCRISGTERFHSHPFIVRWNQLTPDKPLPKSITYQALEAPVAGIVGRGTTEELEVFLRDMFATLRIEPCRKE